MTLPATLVEAEALQLTREHLVRVKAGKLMLWGIQSGWWFDRGDSEAVCRQLMAQWALDNAGNLMDAVRFARAGFELWDVVLREMILEFKNQNHQMPTYLIAYDMELTRGARYSRVSGQPVVHLQVRDAVLAVIVAILIERFGLRPCRTSARRPSACSILARALELEGLAMGEDNVQRIWKNKGRLVKEIRATLQ